MKRIFIRVATVTVLLCMVSGTLSAREASGGWLGISLGTPGLLNANGAYYGKYFGVRGSLCFLNIIEGLDNEEGASYDDVEEPWMFASQANFDFLLYNKDYFLVTLGLVGGVFYAAEQFEERDVVSLYGGAAVGIIYKIFFLEVGIAWLSDYDANLFYYNNNIVPLIQVGVMVPVNF